WPRILNVPHAQRLLDRANADAGSPRLLRHVGALLQTGGAGQNTCGFGCESVKAHCTWKHPAASTQLASRMNSINPAVASVADKEPAAAEQVADPTAIDKSDLRVRRMFASISRRYDFLNHLLSLNIDRYWRTFTTRVASPERGGAVLDCCTGTAD